MMRKLLTSLALGALAVAGGTSSALAWDTANKTWMGIVWTANPVDNGNTELQLNGGNIEARNAAPSGSGFYFSPLGGNGGSINNLAPENKAFWEAMRTSSIVGAPAGSTSPWISWTVIMNYTGGTSQNDMTINGAGGNIAQSVASGTLTPEPGHFGNDRLSVGANFQRAFSIEHKGTGNGSYNSAYARTPSVESGTGNFLPYGSETADTVLRPGFVGGYNATQYETVKWTLGKRLDGTLDIIIEAQSLLSGTKLYTSTLSTDNPDWFFYQLEFRWRGDSGDVVPTNSVQTYTNFSWGNNWGTLDSNATSMIPEPASLGLLMLGSLLILNRRRKA